MSAKRSGRRRGAESGGVSPRYPRTARVNQVLREIIAEALERLAVADDRLVLVTVTAVECDRDLSRARVLVASLDDLQRQALEEARIRLQWEVSRQVRLRRTPQLTFLADPAVRSGQLIEDILRDLGASESGLTASPSQGAEDGGSGLPGFPGAEPGESELPGAEPAGSELPGAEPAGSGDGPR